MNHKLATSMRDYPDLREILDHHSFLSLAQYQHHGKTSCLEHTLDVAEITFKAARKLHLDYISATRGALLHDFYLYDWHVNSPGLHGFKHPYIAKQNAERYFRLNRIERNIILRHMWPLTPIPPVYPESILVCLADKAAAISDYQKEFRKTILSMKPKSTSAIHRSL